MMIAYCQLSKIEDGLGRLSNLAFKSTLSFNASGFLTVLMFKTGCHYRRLKSIFAKSAEVF